MNRTPLTSKRPLIPRSCALTITLAAFSIAFSAITAHAGDYAAWKASSAALAKDPSLVRFYTFEEKSGFTTANVAPGGEGAWTFVSNSPYGLSRERWWWIWNSRMNQTFPEWTQGRWPAKGAITSGLAQANACRSRFGGTKDGVFTMAAWVRIQAPDGTRDETAQLIKVGDGYKAGFRTAYNRAKWAPKGLVEFRMGTPSGPVIVTAQPFEARVWHQLVCQWDGKAVAIYVDGVLKETKPCAGPYVDVKRSQDWAVNMPEQDTGGLDFGGPPVSTRFDLDELAIYDRALSATEVASQYESGKPSDDDAAQRAAFAALDATTTSLSKIKMTIPGETLGIFRRGVSIPATITVPASAGMQGDYKAHYRLCDVDDKVVATETRPLKVSPAADATVTVDFAPKLCGVYFLDMWISDPAGKVVKRLPQEYDFAVTVPVPAAKDIPLSSPLQAHNISGRYFENAFLGFGVDRVIKGSEAYTKTGEIDEKMFQKEFDFDKQAGLKLFFCLHIYAPASSERVPGKKWLMKDMSPWADYCRKMVRTYKDRVAYWEIENEPNAGNLIAADEYAQFLKIGYEAIKAEDPNAIVVGLCGCPGFVSWNEKVYEAGGAKYFDVMSLHNYNAYPIRSTVRERLVEKAIAALVKYRGERVPVWNSETGFHPIARNGSRPLTEDEMRKLYPRTQKVLEQPAYLPADMPTLTEHYTACWQTQSVLLDLAAGCEKFFILSGASHYCPDFNSCDGQPTELAPAFAALQSVLIPSEKVSKISLVSMSDAGAMIRQKDGRLVAALFSEEGPTREFRVDRSGVFTGMDMLGNPMTWTANDDHIIRVKLGQEPVYIFDVPADFAEVNYLKMTTSAEKLPANGVMNGVVSVTNPSGKPLSATLAAIPPKGATLKVDSKLTLQPHETRKLLFQLEAMNLRRGPYELAFVLSSGERELSKLSATFVSDGALHAVPQLTSPASIGDGKWWRDIAPERCVDVESVVKGQPIVGVPWAPQWRGPKDQSFELRSAWQKDGGLLVRIDVTDDIVMPASPDKRGSCFMYDCIELFVDGRKPSSRKETYSAGVEQMLIIPNGKPETAPCDFWFGGKKPTLSAEFVGAHTATGYWVEGRISPEAGTAFNTSLGAEYALDVLLDDTDVDTDATLRKSAMVLHGVFNDASDPTKWGRYQMAPPK
ncbi:MAG TPA: LamG-like jellyroll fold domain-containing protein [Capsulimonadaceae bacterium]|jgi:hypothetical protein